MTLTRWKLLAGVFGLSVCGIAALAEPQCPKTKQATETVAQANCAVAPPIPASVPQVMPAPLAVPVPLPQVAELAPPPAPVPLAIPTIQPVAAPVPQLAVSTPADAAPVAVALPRIEVKETKLETAPPPEFIQDLVKAGEPIAQPMPQITLPMPTPAPQVPAPPAFKPTVQPTAYTAPVSAISDKKFKVLLQFGDTLPKFEIRDGEETLLKVVADKVDVKSPTERSELWATLKAAGQVKFVTPGGEGVCDELQVIPGSGEVVASGSVKYTTTWGKVETAVTSERMTFKLGSAPALAHGDKR